MIRHQELKHGAEPNPVRVRPKEQVPEHSFRQTLVLRIHAIPKPVRLNSLNNAWLSCLAVTCGQAGGGQFEWPLPIR
jgi:hypothetical protein